MSQSEWTSATLFREVGVSPKASWLLAEGGLNKIRQFSFNIRLLGARGTDMGGNPLNSITSWRVTPDGRMLYKPENGR